MTNLFLLLFTSPYTACCDNTQYFSDHLLRISFLYDVVYMFFYILRHSFFIGFLIISYLWLFIYSIIIIAIGILFLYLY